MSSPLSKVITDLAPAKAFYLPKCSGLSSKWLPPLWAGLIIHQLLILLACHCITRLFLGKGASVALVKRNSLLQSDHSSKLQFDCGIQWLICSFFMTVTLQCASGENVSIFSDWKGGIIFTSHLTDIEKTITHGIIISSLLTSVLLGCRCSYTKNFVLPSLSCWYYTS